MWSVRLVGLSLLVLGARIGSADSAKFSLQFDRGRITYLGADVKSGRNVLAKGARLGDLRVVYRAAGGGWTTLESAGARTVEHENGFTLSSPNGLSIDSDFAPSPERLTWTVTIENGSKTPIEVGDLCMPLPMATRLGVRGQFASSFMKHSFVSGAGSFVYWASPEAAMPRLVMTAGSNTSLEYWDAQGGAYRVYCHSIAQGELVKHRGGTWRIPRSSATLAPGQKRSYRFNFDWAATDEGVRDVLVKEGKPDVYVVPGMTVPTDLGAQLALRSNGIRYRLEAEHAEETQIRPEGSRGSYQRFQLTFRHLGENLITLRDGAGQPTYLEFFVTEPLETLIRKRAAFLAKCQHTDPTKWYRGLISEWNMDSGSLLGPDNYDRITGWRIYEVSCDDPGLGKPSFLAAKNAEDPKQSEVTALDDYIQYFVWGGLQQTASEPYPYSIYGIPDWKTNRNSKAPKATDGVAHVWRCYDYPHVILLYYSMYRIAVEHPEVKTRMTAREYLERAFHTAQAMYTIPLKLVNWSPYDTGYYNECIFPSVIASLGQEGMGAEADDLRRLWDRKVKTFILDKPDLFASEYPFDSTGFESTGAIAAYAKDRESELGISSEQVRQFTDRQMAANIFCRGSIEPAYYTLGSDFRGGGSNGYLLSYMAQMGGGYVLDYGLRETADPAPYLRLGYSSLLSSWALMNTGAAASNYGYWYPGAQNDGGAGGGFEPAADGTTWLGQPHHRGSWYYGCEIDLGFSGYLRRACTVLADDPIFGLTCFGGTINGHTISPKDGIRRRFYVRTKGLSLDVELDGAKFAAGPTIKIDGGVVAATLNRNAGGPATVSVRAPAGGSLLVALNGVQLGRVAAGQKMSFALPRGMHSQTLMVKR